MDLSYSLGTLRSQRNFNRKKKLDSFRRRDRMILKQITPPKDIAFLKSGLLEVQVICGFFIHCVSVKKIIKAVKFQKSRFKPISSKQMHLLRIYISPRPKKVNLSTEPELKPIMKINVYNAAFSQYMYGNYF